MARLGDLRPREMREIQVPTSSRCEAMQKFLEAGDSAETRITKSAQEIARSVLERDGVGLSVAERKALPNLILQAKFDEYQDAFARAVIANYAKSDRFWRRLFRAWLLEYNPDGVVGRLVLEALSLNRSKLPPDLQGIANRHPVLSKNPDFSNTARALMDNEISPDDKLALGLSERGVVSTRLASRILDNCAQLLKSGDATEAQLKSFRDIVAPANAIHESVQMPAMVGLILGAVKRSPGEQLVDEIAKLIGDTFDDPMVRRDRWPSVTQELGGTETRELCIDTVRKWQVFRSITMFFRIIERVVGSDRKHHFPARRDFWLDYFNRGVVTDAWVVLGSKAANEMRGVISDAEDAYRGLKWGKLSGGSSDQCALLLRLGTATVMEFSHSGAVRMWGEKDRDVDVPKLYRSSYLASELRADCPTDQMFRHDANGNWRIPASRCISKLTGTATRI